MHFCQIWHIHPLWDPTFPCQHEGPKVKVSWPFIAYFYFFSSPFWLFYGRKCGLSLKWIFLAWLCMTSVTMEVKGQGQMLILWIFEFFCLIITVIISDVRKCNIIWSSTKTRIPCGTLLNCYYHKGQGHKAVFVNLITLLLHYPSVKTSPKGVWSSVVLSVRLSTITKLESLTVIWSSWNYQGRRIEGSGCGSSTHSIILCGLTEAGVYF